MMNAVVSLPAMSMAKPSPAGMSLSAFAANTSPRMMPLGMDRSMPPVAITNVVPMLTTVRIATFWASSDRLFAVPNLPGARIEKMTMSASRKPRVMNTWLATSWRQRERAARR